MVLLSPKFIEILCFWFLNLHFNESEQNLSSTRIATKSKWLSSYSSCHYFVRHSCAQLNWAHLSRRFPKTSRLYLSPTCVCTNMSPWLHVLRNGGCVYGKWSLLRKGIPDKCCSGGQNWIWIRLFFVVCQCSEVLWSSSERVTPPNRTGHRTKSCGVRIRRPYCPFRNRDSRTRYILYHSWPGYTRLVTSTDGSVKEKKPQQHCPVNKGSENGPNETAAESDTTNRNDSNSDTEVESTTNVVTTIEVGDNQKLSEGKWPKDLFNVQNVNVFYPSLPWESVIFTWNRIERNGNWRVSFSFPVTVFGTHHDFQRVNAIVGGVNIKQD